MPNEVILIAAVTVDGYIARHSLEVTSWSMDLPLFKKQTMGFPIIMGSNTKKTLFSELKGRKNIVFHRQSDPQKTLENISGTRCFIIGGGKTFSVFYKFLTHMYITPHPYIFGQGVRLFENKVEESKLVFQKTIIISRARGVYQYQYKFKNS
jgi:dihydrofolate reductase